MSHPSSSQSAPASEQNLPEKPASVRHSTAAQTANQQPIYPQQQPQLQPYQLPKAEPYKPSKPFSVAKLVLGCCNLVFAIICLGLSLGLIALPYSFDAIIAEIIVAVAAGASIIWQGADFIVLAARRTWRPIHPGAHVGVHLILWILCLLVVLSLSAEIAYLLADYTVDSRCAGGDSGGYYDGGDYDDYVWCDYYTFPTQKAADMYIRMMEALDAFSVLMLISHFTFFIMACVEANQRRRYGSRTKVVYVVANSNHVDGTLYYTPVAPLQQAKRESVAVQSQPVGGADPGAHGYYAPAAPAPVQHHGSPPGTAA